MSIDIGNIEHRKSTYSFKNEKHRDNRDVAIYRTSKDKSIEFNESFTRLYDRYGKSISIILDKELEVIMGSIDSSHGASDDYVCDKMNCHSLSGKEVNEFLDNLLKYCKFYNDCNGLIKSILSPTHENSNKECINNQFQALIKILELEHERDYKIGSFKVPQAELSSLNKTIVYEMSIRLSSLIDAQNIFLNLYVENVSEAYIRSIQAQLNILNELEHPAFTQTSTPREFMKHFRKINLKTREMRNQFQSCSRSSIALLRKSPKK